MTEYTDGLGWAAIHVCALKLPAGCDANYYLLGSILLIGSLLALMFTESNNL
jgi:hypothetical protein